MRTLNELFDWQPLSLLHLIFISLWGGVLLVEFLIEIAARKEEQLRFAATLHFWIDLLFEIPLLMGILITGALLTSRTPLTPLLLVKISCALIAIGINLACAILVILRYRRRENPQALARYHHRIRYAALGLPFGLIALYLGFFYSR